MIGVHGTVSKMNMQILIFVLLLRDACSQVHFDFIEPIKIDFGLQASDNPAYDAFINGIRSIVQSFVDVSIYLSFNDNLS